MLFSIYENGQFQNENRLNFIGKTVYNFFQWYVSSRQTYHSLIDTVKIFSLQRSNSPSHSLNKAVDIGIEPLYFNPYFFNILHEYYQFNIYLSAHNRHLHIDHHWTRTLENNQIIPWRNQKRVEYVNPSRRTRYTTRPPDRRQFLSVPDDLSGASENQSLITRYQLQSYRNDFDSTFPYHQLAYRGEIGRLLAKTYYDFPDQIPENQKKTPPETSVWRESFDIISQPRETNIPWDKILLTAGLMAGIVALSDSKTESMKIKRIEFE